MFKVFDGAQRSSISDVAVIAFHQLNLVQKLEDFREYLFMQISRASNDIL